MKCSGIVYLIGAGPGDVGLLTLRGAELLGEADVVVYDALVNPDLLRLAPDSAEVIFGGKRSRDHAISQEKLNALLVEKAREGKTVVRLKGGDPYIFGRGGEEAEELVEADVPFEVVPGISSFVAGPSYAGIPLTHRDHSSSFTVITGHQVAETNVPALDVGAMAGVEGTKVVLMGVGRVKELTASMLQCGMEAKTPAAMVRWGTVGQQETIVGTLDTIADLVEERKFSAPAVMVLGDVVNLQGKLNWFEKRPLFGKRVVVTRSRDKASELGQKLSRLGADILEIPTIRFTTPDDRTALVDALLALGSYDWVIFTSPRGVTTFFDYFFKSFKDIRNLGALRVAAVGPATAAELAKLHIQVDVMPESYVGRNVADAIKAHENVENLKLLIARAQVANKDLPNALEEDGAIVDDIGIYKTVADTEDPYGMGNRLQEAGADWITFTSRSTVDHFNKRFDLETLQEKFPRLRLASIGPETTKGLDALGIQPTVEASEHTIEGLASAIVEFERSVTEGV